MEIKITKEKETPLLSRKRITAWVQAEGPTPSRIQLCGEIAKLTHTKPELVSIRHIYSRFGKLESKIIAHIYKDAETMLVLEGKQHIDKHKPKKEGEQPKEE